jgi:uncharacterized repeat protein (TIGR01451 family)
MYTKRITSVMISILIVFIVGAAAWLSPRAAPANAQAASPNTSASESGALLIPNAPNATPKIDGFCDEYAAAISKTFLDGNGKEATVYLMHNGTRLFVCLKAQPGTYKERFASLYLDPQGDGSSYDFAQKDDYSLRINIPGTTRSSLHGTGVANGYVTDSSVDGFWDGAATTSQTGDTAEYSIEIGRFKFGDCDKLFGIAVYHHWFAGVGDDYGWPSNQWFDQPRTWQLASLDNGPCANPGRNGKIAYVFRGNTEDATSFFNLLTANGYTVTLVPLASVLSTDFSTFDLIVVADDTGNLNDWGLPGLTPNQVAQIRAPSPDKPIIGLGEGGYAFFGQWPLFIGWPNGWHGPDQDLKKAATAPAAYFTGIAADPVIAYVDPVNAVAIYLGGASLPADAFAIGMENPDTNHANLIQQGCDLLWGFSGNPYTMSGDGKTLFLNSVWYMRNFQCAPEPPTQPTTCLDVVKTAIPAAGTAVSPGTIIEYTITYTLNNDPACKNPKEARLTDTIPYGTVFVPGSASDGVTPGADGALNWAVFSSNTAQTKTFKVRVSDNACYDPATGAAGSVNNRATLFASGHAPVVSPDVVHPVSCPPIRLPNGGPMYAEDEITIDPYPLYIGHPSKIQVRVQNASGVAQTVNVAFQTSPDKFGIGIPFNTFAADVITIPAHGSAIAEAMFTPAASGHYCIQIVITGAGLNEPLITQRNLDVTEDLKPGVPDTLTFMVGNPTTTTADVTLVVVNDCPGWSAVISSPAGGVLTGMAPGETRPATLTVTPPASAILGSGCHIDVEGWIGNRLIGGIRKLDIPPVHLPPNVVPVWEEREISFIPEVPIAGVPGQICVELQNPLDVSKTITLTVAVADFGAGIGFTPAGTQSFTLPPHSLAKYCINWTPATSGTLHRCVLVTLQQPNFRDMYSQHNVDIQRRPFLNLVNFPIPFVIGNTDLVSHTLTLVPTLYGIDPGWQIGFFTPEGDPAPGVINANSTINLNMILIGLLQTDGATAAPSSAAFGDVQQIQVSVRFDGQEVGGFTIQVDPYKVYLPLIIR